MKPHGIVAAGILIWSCATGPLRCQGPGSCGYHLDVRANLTSTHSAVADGGAIAPGAGAGLPVGAPGSPYTAYATPGSPMAFVVSGNPLAFGPGPIGPGSCLSMFYAVGPPVLVALPAAPPIIGTCGGGPLILGVLPAPLTFFDTCGFFGPPPALGYFDVGSGKFTVTASYPVFAPPVLVVQGVGMTPAGALWITNAVGIVAGPNPAEVPVPVPVACGPFPVLDEGQSLANPTAAFFEFGGIPTPVVDIDTNGFVDMVPGVGPAIAGGCDFVGSSGDLGCGPAVVLTPQARPRIDVNHADFDFGVVPAAPFVPAITMEFRPAGPSSPPATIYRWKNAPDFGAPAGIPGLMTSDFCIEFWSSPLPGFGGVAVVVRTWTPTAGQIGFGPGIAGQGYFGPPPIGLPSTCAMGPLGLALMTTFGPPLGIPYFTGLTGAIHMNSLIGSIDLGPSAVWFWWDTMLFFGASAWVM